MSKEDFSDAKEKQSYGADEKGNGENGKDVKEPEFADSVSVTRLFHYADKYDYLLMFLGAIGAMGNGIAQPISFIIFGKLIEKFIDFKSTEPTGQTLGNQTTTAAPTFDIDKEMKLFGIYYVCLAAGMFVCAFLQGSCWAQTAARQVHKIRKRFFSSIMKQDIGWFDVIESNSLSSRLSDDILKIEGGIGDKVGVTIQSVCMFFGGFIVGFIYSWKLTLVILSVVPVLALVGGAFGKVMANLSSEEQNAYASAGSVVNEVVSSIRTVAAFGGEQEEIERYTANLGQAEKAGLKKAALLGSSMGLLYIVIFGSYALGFWYGSKLVGDGEISGGEMLIVFFSVMIGGFQIGQLAPNFEGVNKARGAAYFIYEVIEKVPIINCLSDEGHSIENVSGDISFEDINFYYPSRADIQVLKNFNLEIKSGDTIALVGESGCGKSTIVKLVQRFYDPNSGTVSLDGRDLKDLNLKWLRSNIGIVSQEPVLFELTIGENIKMGEAGHATQADIERAAKNANAHDFIMSFPSQYDTYVGEGGAQLSGGQKQRIAIARALVRDPKILLFDEATSALDTESEAIVQQALDKASEGRTTIIIAHRLSTVKNADKIIACQDGCVVESGTHEELIAKRGFYYQLVLLQTMADEHLLEDEEEDTVENEAVLRNKVLRTISTFSEDSEEDNQELIDELTHRLHSRGSIRRSMGSLKMKQEDSEKKAEVDEDEDEKIEPASYFRILSITASEWPYFLCGSIFSAVVGAFPLAFAIILSELLGEFSNPETIRTESVKYALYFLLLGFCEGIAFFMSSVLFGKAGEVLTRRLRTQAFTAILRQDIGYFDMPENSTGKIGARLATDASNVQGATSAQFNVMVQVFVMAISALILAFYYSWKLTLVILAFVPLLVIAGAAQMKVFTNLTVGSANKFVSANALATQAIMNIRTVAGLGKEVYFISKFKSLINGPYQGTKKSSIVYGISFGLSFSIMMCANAAAFVVGGKLVQQDLKVEDMFKVVLCTMFAAMTAGQVFSMAPDFVQAKISASRIFAIIDRQPPIDSFSKEGDKLNTIDGNIILNYIDFHYPTRPGVKVLDGFSLEIKAGQKIALVGSSGCGKSTNIGLLERFYDPLEGWISLDGRNTKELNIKWLRSILGLVSQEPVLFAKSVKDNICYGVQGRYSNDEIEEAAKDANIHSFISSLPRGYETMVGEKGTLISGGQKQRIAIARALIRDPKIMLLDEATSALDSESEKLVQEALDLSMKGRTSIIIAHRLSTIQNADVIVVIQNGKVVEMGTHEELIAKDGVYCVLIKAQL